jgi:hypothetical protein
VGAGGRSPPPTTRVVLPQQNEREEMSEMRDMHARDREGLETTPLVERDPPTIKRRAANTHAQ